MEIIGHKLIDFTKFNLINVLAPDVFDQTKKFDNLIFNFNELIVQKAKEQQKEFSLIVKDISEILLANGFGAKYIVINLANDTELLKEAVKLAEFYLFDSKIATIIKSKNELEIAAKFGCDAVIFEEAINKFYYI